MNKIIILFACLMIFLWACDPYKEPYKPPAYHAKAVVIGEEKCVVDSNYNYWLLDLSIENSAAEKGDTILYNGVVYNHAFKTLNLDKALKQTGKKVSTEFNFSNNDRQPTQSINCNAPDAETFLLVNLILFNQAEIK